MKINNNILLSPQLSPLSQDFHAWSGMAAELAFVSGLQITSPNLGLLVS